MGDPYPIKPVAVDRIQTRHRTIKTAIPHSDSVGRLMQDAAHHIHKKYRDHILAHHGRGMVASLHCVRRGGTEPDTRLAWRVVGRAVQHGSMLFAPVRYSAASVKLCPPLVTEEDALREGMTVLDEVFAAEIGPDG